MQRGDLKLLTGYLYSICGIAFALLWLTDSGEVTHNPFSVKYKDGTEEQFSYSLNANSSDKSKSFEVRGEIEYQWLKSNRILIIPDDCLEELQVNGTRVELSAVPGTELCDYRAGFQVSVSQYLHSGKNTFSAKLNDKGGGKYGFLIRRVYPFWFRIFTLLLLTASLTAFILPLYRFAEKNYLPRMGQSTRWVAAGVLLGMIAFVTYVVGFEYPNAPIWDENYHIASAEKYLNHTHFHEPHPPLGKLIIALSEEIFGRGGHSTPQTYADHIKDFPPDFNFYGYRVIPVWLGWACVILFFVLVGRLTGSIPVAFILGSAFAFENSMITHFRSAMLDSAVMFFFLSCLYAFFEIYRKHAEGRIVRWWLWTFFGVSLGAAMATKYNLFIIVLLPVIILLQHRKIAIRTKIIMLSKAALVAFLVWAVVWQIHFSLGKKINTQLPEGGYYHSSSQYRELIGKGNFWSFQYFPTRIMDALEFFKHYSKGVPVLNMCKSNENGSPAWLWPMGGKAISFRWETVDQGIRYLYLQVNPLVWWFGSLGVFLMLCIWLSRFLLPYRPFNELPIPFTHFTLVSLLYVIYMLVMLNAPRVMYLYHYHPPFILSLLLSALLLPSIQNLGWFSLKSESRRQVAGIFLVCLFAIGYLYYRPLSTYQALYSDQVKERAWLGVWGLNCVNCKKGISGLEPCAEK